MKVIGTNNSEYDKFEFHCSEKGLTKSEQLRNLIQDFLNDMTQEQTKQPESIQA